MKKYILVTLLVASTISHAELKKSVVKKASSPKTVETTQAAPPVTAKTEIDSDAKQPREVWTFTYHEYGLLKDEQKEKFIKNFAMHAKHSLFLNQMSELKTKDTIKDALSSEKDWSRIESKVNKYCQDRTHAAECEKIAAARDQVLMEYRAHK